MEKERERKREKERKREREREKEREILLGMSWDDRTQMIKRSNAE
jgi:hypothetical protein